MAAGATSSTGRPRRAAISSGRTRPLSAATVACTMLIGLDEPRRLGQHVVDAGALQHGAHRATGDDAGTGAGRLEQHDAGRRLALDRVRDRRGDPRHPEEVLLGLLDALGDRRGHLLGLAVADADLAVAVADDDERGEAEAPTALDDLGDAVDRDDALDVGALLGTATAAAAAVTAAAPGRRRPGAGVLASDVHLLSVVVRAGHQNSSPSSRAPSASAAMRPWYALPPRSKTTVPTPFVLGALRRRAHRPGGPGRSCRRRRRAGRPRASTRWPACGRPCRRRPAR